MNNDNTKGINFEKNITSPLNIDDKNNKLNYNKKSIYNHIIGKRNTKTPSIHHTNVNIKKENSVGNLVLDRFSSFLHGETSEQRKTRINLIRYKDMLAYELELFKYNKDLHRDHGIRLVNEFQIQENQLLKWSQCELIMKSFKLQSWLRVSRSKLLEEITLTSIGIIDFRLKKTEKIIKQFTSSINNTNDKNAKTHELSEYSKFSSKTIENILDNDRNIKNYFRQLISIDKFCSVYLNTFQLNIPLIDSISENDRTKQLNEILINYKKYIILCDKATVNSNISYNEFLKFYKERNNEMKKLEERFSNFAEDEREREGRLIRRFCALISNDDNINTKKEKNILYYSKIANFYPEKFPNDSIEAANNRISSLNENDLILSPTSIMAFIKYFAINIISKRYSISMEYLDALLALSESLLFKRITSRIFIYNDELKNKDKIWREQCEIASNVSPLEYGLPLEYFENNNNNNNNSNEFIDSSIFNNIEITDDSNEKIDTIVNIKKYTFVSIEKEIIEEDKIENNIDEIIIDNVNEHEKNNIIKGIMESYNNNLNIISFLQIKNDSKFGKHYSNSARIMSQMATSTSPREITFNLLMSLKVLTHDATICSCKDEAIGADLMFPLLVNLLITSKLPNMHLILTFLQDFTLFDRTDEVTYYVTCLEAAIEFIYKFELNIKHILQDDEEGAYINVANPKKIDQIYEDISIENLGDWLREQNTMEDTISLLIHDGWMI